MILKYVIINFLLSKPFFWTPCRSVGFVPFFVQRMLLINPITYEGEGGFLAKTIRLLTITLKRHYLSPPNFMTFSFHLLDTFGRVLAKSIHQGVAAVVFEMRRLQKLNI